MYASRTSSKALTKLINCRYTLFSISVIEFSLLEVHHVFSDELCYENVLQIAALSLSLSLVVADLNYRPALEVFLHCQ